MRAFGRARRQGPWLAMLVVVLLAELLFFAWFAEGFYSGVSSLLALTLLFSAAGIVALGLAIVVIGGGIDLSVGAIASLSSVVMAVLWQEGLQIWAAAGVGLALACLLGLVNGALVLALRIDPLICTLATSFIFGSLAVVVAGSTPPYNFPDSFTFLGQNATGGVPFQLWLFVALAIGLALLMTKTTFGRAVTMIGSNREAARYVGLSVARVTLATYVVSGALAGVAGIVLASYYGAVRADLGSPLLLAAITIVVLGGVNIFGGEGSLVGVAVATLIVGFLQQGILTLGAQDLVADMATGGVLILAVVARIAVGHGQGQRVLQRLRLSRSIL